MLDNLKIELDKFRKSVIQQAKSNLTRNNKSASKRLYNSLKSDLKISQNSFELNFSMEDYGEYQDKGVRGKNPSKVSKNARIQGQQAPNSPFHFGSGKVGNYSGFVNSLEKWIKRRNFRLRDDKGRYKKGNTKTLAHIIAGNIYNRGLKPSLFFTKPFENEYKKLSDDLIKAFGLDAEQFMTYTLTNYKK